MGISNVTVFVTYRDEHGKKHHKTIAHLSHLVEEASDLKKIKVTA